MRISVRQRYPESGKGLKLIKTYEGYAQFEADLADASHIKGEDSGIARRTIELAQESTKTIEALKQKQPVRIPEVKQAEKSSDNIEKSTRPLNL